VNRRGGLGKGLAALIPPGDDVGNERTWLAELPIGSIQPNPRQPRDVFDDEELDGLAESIRDMGLLQPVVVRQTGDDVYELVAGERRLRASKRAGLERIPAVVRRTGDADLLKEALVENIHRVQLNPLEEAAAYQQLLEDFDFTQEELARKLGKSRPAISNALRLLQLPPAVQRRVAAGVVSAGHAKALLALADDPVKMDKMASRVVAEGMSVRALEETIRLTLLEPAEPGRERGKGRSTRMTAPGLVELQHDLSDALGARVRISMGARKGKLQVEFASVDDLERIVGVIARGLEDGEVATDVLTTSATSSASSGTPPSPAGAPPPAATGSSGVDVDRPALDLPPPSGSASAADLPPADVLPSGPAAVDLPAPPTWSADGPDALPVPEPDEAPAATAGSATADGSIPDADAATTDASSTEEPVAADAATDVADDLDDLDEATLDELTRPD
jgi:ParB family transcriptional regulator, chromosome partitioning protein